MMKSSNSEKQKSLIPNVTRSNDRRSSNTSAGTTQSSMSKISRGLDNGIKTDFKIKLTPKHDDPVYAKSLPTTTNLKNDLVVELALMQEYGIITTLPYSKYSSPIFEQRKPNGKLRIVVDLRRINHILKNDYNQHNHPVTTIADAAQHMASLTNTLLQA